MYYSDISPRTQAYADKRLLKRAVPNNILGQFGQTRTVPQGKGKVAIFRRYNKLAAATLPLLEGVTPTGKTLTKTDIPVTLQQYGDWIGITDVILDTHEDPVLNESIDILGEQAPETYDILRAGVLLACSNRLYSNGTTRTSVNTVVDRDLFRTAVRGLKAQHAKKITSKIVAGPNIGTVPVPAAFPALCHSNLQPDLERCEGWKGVEEYAAGNTIYEGEAGKIGELRFIFDNNITPYEDAGGLAATYGVLSTTGTSADVYPIIVLGQDAWGKVELGGKGSVQTYVNNPKAINGDELAQRGSVGWKGWHAAVILNDLWMMVIETAAKG